MHYDSIGNIQLRDKYVDLALSEDASDDTVVYLRGWLQKRSDLIPKKVINRHLSTFEKDDAAQHARALLMVGRPLEAAVKYIEDINASLQRGRWFAAAFYVREFNEKGLLTELLKSAYTQATEDGELWWQVRALQELGWHSELKELLLKNKEAIETSGNPLLMTALASAEGNETKAKELRKEITRNTRIE